jgi:acyl carrier protein
MASTLERLRLILERDYKVDPAAVTAEATLESLNIDSLGATELLFTIEDEFEVRVTKEPVDLRTVADVVAYIDGMVAAAALP